MGRREIRKAGLDWRPVIPLPALHNISSKVPFSSPAELPIPPTGKRAREGPRVLCRARRHVTASLLTAGTIVTLSLSVGGVLSAAPAGAAGILPPANPPSNIAPTSPDWLRSVDAGRAAEGVGPMAVSEAALAALPIDQQVLTVVNDERIDRGLPPIDYITSQLDAAAQAGANAGGDPSFPSALTGGAPITYGGSVWAGGLSSNVLEADYYWMYDDGWSGATTTNG